MKSDEELGADLYRALHRGRPGDVDFYLRAATGAQSALELGAGWGRVLGPLSRALPRAIGLERSPILAAMAREAGLDVREGDMRAFDLKERFERVFIPYGGVYCLLDETALLDTLRCARRHLEPGGLMVFDSWSADDFHANAERWDEELFEDVDELELEGVQYTVAERTRWHRDEQRLDVSYRFTPRRGGEPAMDELPQRYLLSEEIPRLMEDAGLELVVIHGGFDQHVHDEDSEQLIVTAQRPEDDAN